MILLWRLWAIWTVLYWRGARCTYHDICAKCLQSTYMFIDKCTQEISIRRSLLSITLLWKNHTWVWSENYISSLCESIACWPLLLLSVFSAVYLSVCPYVCLCLYAHFSVCSCLCLVCLSFCSCLRLSVLLVWQQPYWNRSTETSADLLYLSICLFTCLFVSEFFSMHNHAAEIMSIRSIHS